MAYTPKHWECDDVITANDMNNIEEGIANASQSTSLTPLYVGIDAEQTTDDYSCLDTTFGEIKQAILYGRQVYWLQPTEGGGISISDLGRVFFNGNPLDEGSQSNGGSIFVEYNQMWYDADTDEDYPSWSE